MTRKLVILGSTGSIGRQTFRRSRIARRGFSSRLHVRGHQCRTRRRTGRQAPPRSSLQLPQRRQALKNSPIACAPKNYAAPRNSLRPRRHRAGSHSSRSRNRSLRRSRSSRSPGNLQSCIELAKHIALANKEVLVAAGEVVMAAAKKHNVARPPSRQRTQRHPPMPTRRREQGSKTPNPNRLRRPLPQNPHRAIEENARPSKP